MSNGAEQDIRELRAAMLDLVTNGCAQRKGDEDRMKLMEKSNERIHTRLDWIHYLLIVNLVVLVINLASRYLGGK